MKRVALLLLAGLFGFAALQTATAQPTHKVNIEVASVTTLTLNGNVSIDIDKINKWTPDEGGTTYNVETNKSGRIIEAKVSNFSGDAGGLGDVGLKVDAKPPTDASSDEEVIITDVGDSDQGYETVVTGITDVSEDKLSLDYKAKVNENISPGDNSVTLTVKYTITSSD